jgi:hypothetical protein
MGNIRALQILNKAKEDALHTYIPQQNLSLQRVSPLEWDSAASRAYASDTYCGALYTHTFFVMRIWSQMYTASTVKQCVEMYYRLKSFRRVAKETAISKSTIHS